MYNIEATIRAFLRALEAGTSERVRIVAHSDYYVIEEKQGIIMSEFDFADVTGHRKYINLYKDNGDHTFNRIQHPLIYDLEFSLTIYSDHLANIYQLQETVDRFFLGTRRLEVEVVAGEETGEFEHEIDMVRAFRGTFRANLSDLKQMEARVVIKNIPVYAISTPFTGKMITDILMRIEDDTDADNVEVVGDYRIPEDSEAEW